MFFLLILSFSPTFGFQFDNALKDRPKIQCGHGQIHLGVETEKDRPAHIFVKNHFKQPGCSFSNTSTVDLDFSRCDVSRRREISPKGMSYSLTIVVQLHPLFVTRVDRAYHVKCMYQEAEKPVGTNMTVNELATVALPAESPLPQCAYTLHKDSPNGPVTRYASVGDNIYHVWDCPSDTYAMLVHSCTVLDGHGNSHKVIDDKGCTMDEFLIPDLTYSNDLTRTFTAASAFNFPDENNVHFNCQIRACVKGTEDCDQITPPRCGIQRDDGSVGKDYNDFERDQLFTSNVGGITKEEENSFPSTPTSPTSEPFPATTTVIVTTVTELTSTAAPEIASSMSILSTTKTTTTASPSTTAAFRTPEPLIPDEIEGSGVEIAKTTVGIIVADQSGDEIYIRPGERRDIRRRDAVFDLDVNSPELTVLDKEFAAEASAALKLESEPKASVCVPLMGFWLLVALLIGCTLVLTVTVLYAQRQRRKERLFA